MNKTPATVLQEFCVQRKLNPPFYMLIRDGTKEADKIFTYQLQAFNEEVTGTGRSKQTAKHNAANNMLEVLKESNLIDLPSNIEVQSVQSIEGNAIGDLLDICVQRTLPLPKFTLLNGSGPSHAPEFTYECIISSMKRMATCTTKKGAKQKVAQKMISILQNMQYDNDDNKTVATAESILADDDERKNKKIRTYLDYKNCEIKPLSVNMAQRHNYFKNFEDEKKEAFNKFVFDKSYSPEDKVKFIMKEWDHKYEVTDLLFKHQGPMKMFTLRGNYDCVLVGTRDKIYDEVLTFIYSMMK